MIDTKGGASKAKASGGTAERKNGASRRMANSASRPTSPEKRAASPKTSKPKATHRTEKRRQRAVTFEPVRLSDYTRAAMLDELRRVAPLVTDAPLTRLRFDRLARVSSPMVVKRFGTWRRALEQAGLLHRHITHSSAGFLRMDRTQRLSKKQIAAELRALGQAKPDGRVTTTDIEDSESLSLFVIRSRFGQWSAALRAAGLPDKVSGRRYTNAELYRNMKRVWRHCRRAPRALDMERAPSRIGMASYIRRFGTWNRAVNAFAALANAGGKPEAYAPPGVAAVGPDAVTPMTEAERRGNERRRERQIERVRRRDVPPLLRYRILLRDDFRCTQCGDSPAITRGCTLQIDHIVPFSKGGRTEPGNLRTLCRRCNVGRGAKAEDGHAATAAPSAAGASTSVPRGPRKGRPPPRENDA